MLFYCATVCNSTVKMNFRSTPSNCNHHVAAGLISFAVWRGKVRRMYDVGYTVKAQPVPWGLVRMLLGAS